MRCLTILLAVVMLMMCAPRQMIVQQVVPVDGVLIDTVYSGDSLMLVGKDSVRVDTLLVTNWKNRIITKYVTVTKCDTVDRKVLVTDTVFKQVRTGNPWPGILILVGALMVLIFAVIFFKKP